MKKWSIAVGGLICIMLLLFVEQVALAPAPSSSNATSSLHSGYSSVTTTQPYPNQSNAGSWLQATGYPFGIDDHSCVAYDGTLYCVGGSRGPGYDTNASYYATINPKGGIGNWTATTNYPMTLYDSFCGAWNGTMYCVGGTYAGTTYNRTYYARLSPTGIGQWTATTTYPLAVFNHTCFVDNGVLYCIGGTVSSYDTSAVYYAALSSNGIGAWKQTAGYPVRIDDFDCEVYDGYVYCVGGWSVDSAVYNSTYYARLSPSGGIIGNWTATTPYPTPMYDQACTSSNENLYCFGGVTSLSIYSLTANVFSARMSPSGGLGAWSSEPTYPIKVRSQFAMAYNNAIYVIGGYYDPTSTIYNNTYYLVG
jgi:hypothetical protein